MPKKDGRIIKAEQLYREGMRLVDIGKTLNVPASTVRRWKSEKKWDGERKTERSDIKSERSAKKNERSKMTETKKKVRKKEETEQNSGPLNEKQKLFCLYYVKCFNATKAYQKAYGSGYNSARAAAPRLLANISIKEEIERLKSEKLAREFLTVDDIYQKYIDIAFADITDFMEFGTEEVPVVGMYGPVQVKDEDGQKKVLMQKESYARFRSWDDVDGSLISEIKTGRNGTSIKLPDRVKALQWLADHVGALTEEQQTKLNILKLEEEKKKPKEKEVLEHKDPHDVIIPEFWEVLDDEEHEHVILTSGRAGTKSSFAGILAIETITGEKPASVVVLRKRHNKLRKTVYKEIIRAITRLGMSKDEFDIKVSPMEIRCKKTGNTVYFSGSDSIDDTKGIIDEDRPIAMVVLDELTEFFDVGEGEEELTNIEATFVRGNDEGFKMVYLYNPPKNPNAEINVWCKKMELRDDVIHKHVDYRDVPISWIGQKLIDAAEALKKIDERLYRWVWLGEQIGVDDLIYYMFGDHLIQPPKAPRYKLVGIGVDYGQQNATTYQAAGININTRKLEGLSEFYHSGRESGKQKSPSEYAKAMIDLTDELNKKYQTTMFYVFIDPSAKGLAEEIKRLARQSKPYNLIMKDAENDVKLGIQRVQKCYTYGIKTVSENQPNMIRELGTYEYDKDSIKAGNEKPVKVDDHCCDADRYLTMGMWSKIKHFLPEGERD